MIESDGGRGREMQRTTLNQMGARVWMTPLKIWRNSILTLGTWDFCVDSLSFGIKKGGGGRKRTVVVMIMVGSNRAVFLWVYCVPGIQYQCWAGRLHTLPVVDILKLHAADSWDTWEATKLLLDPFLPAAWSCPRVIPKMKVTRVRITVFLFYLLIGSISKPHIVS